MNFRTATPTRTLLFGFILLMLTGCETVSERDAYGAKHHSFRFSLFSYNIRSDGQQCRAEWSKAPHLAPSLWQRAVNRYQMPNSDTNPRIIKERGWYTSHQSYLNRVSARSSRYLHYVVGQLEARNLPGELALLPIVESAYNPFAVSTSNASGLWQFIPGTAKHLGMDMNWWYDARRDVPAATNKALDYLVFLRNHYDGDWLKALAAYNAGWGTIDKAVAKNRARGLPTDYWSLDVPTETKAYVPKLLALAQISKQPEKFGINWAYIPDLPYFSEVHFSGQIDLGFAADLAKVDSDELHLLNPGVSRWATPPGGPYRLLVPIDQANDLQERIASMNGNELLPNAGSLNSNNSFNPHVQALEDKAARNTKTRLPSSSSVSKSNSTLNSKSRSNSSSSSSYTVKSGDTLWSIAKKTGTTADALRKANNLRAGQTLSQGQKISLPSSSATTKKTSSKITSHTVKSGDTLMAISRQYKVSVNDIMRWNSLSKNNTAIKPGQRIKLHLD